MRNILVAAMVGAVALLAGAQGASGGQWSGNVAIPGTGAATTELGTLVTPDRGTFAYWLREVGGDQIVQSVRIAADGTTGPVQSLSAPGQDAGDPVAVVAPSGIVTVAWIRSNGTNDVIQSVTVSPTGTVGPVTDRSAAGGALQNAEQPAIAVAPDGTVALTWRRFNGLVWVAQVITIPEGGTANPVKDVSTVPMVVPAITAPPVGSPPGTPGTPIPAADQAKFGNANSPGVTALPDSTFRMAWVREAGKYSNVMTTTVTANGTPGGGEPLFLQNYALPATAQEFYLGATGDPRDSGITSNQDGNVMIVWNRIFVSTHSDPADPTKQVVDGVQRGAELLTLTPAGVPLTPIPGQLPGPKIISPFWANITDLELTTNPGLGSAVTWYSDLSGVKQSQYSPLGLRGRFAGSLGLPASPLGEFTYPDGGVGPGRWGAVAWYEKTGVPGINQAHVYNISPNVAPTGVRDLSGASLKSSEQPQVTVDSDGVPTVVFYGVDMSDNGSLWFTRYTDPGILASPGRIRFNNGMLNTVSSPQSIQIVNTGTTPNNITGIELTGAGAGDFRIQNRNECLGVQPARNPCRLKVAFAPSQVGPAPPAKVQIDSVAGSFSTSLSGRGVARTRVTISVKKRRQAARPGRTVSIRAVVRNAGGIPAKGVKVCFSGNRRVFSKGKSCTRISGFRADAQRAITFKTRVRRKARPGRVKVIMARIRANNARNQRVPVLVRLKRR